MASSHRGRGRKRFVKRVVAARHVSKDDTTSDKTTTDTTTT